MSALLASLLALNARLATGPNGKCLRGKSRDGNEKDTARPLLPLRATGDSCVGSLRDLLHVEAAGRRILWWTARSGSRARWLPLPRLWRSRTEKRSIIVHHRVPGVSELRLMISLCPGCHAKVERTNIVLSEMSPLLLELWREQHTDGQEQIMLAFNAPNP